KETQTFFQKVESMEIPELLLFSLEQKLETDKNASDQLIQKISKEKKSIWNLYEILKRNKQLDKLPKNISKQDIALAVLTDENGINEKEDSIQFLTTKTANYKNKSYEIYFFKVKSKNIYSGMDMTEIGYAAFDLDKDKTFKINHKKETQNQPEIQKEINLEEAYEAVEIAAAPKTEFQEDSAENTVYTQAGIEYIDDESLKETYQTEIDRVLFHDKKRASFGEDYYGGYLGF